MKAQMYTVKGISDLISKGESFALAGDENLLKQLPRGKWIAGTIPYFIGDKGGVVSKDLIYATPIPKYVKKVSIASLDEKGLETIYKAGPKNGFTLLILPAMSPVHLSYAINAPYYEDFAATPVVGWIAGMHLSDLGKVSAKVVNGQTGEVSDQKAVVMQIELEQNYVSEVGIVNIFEQGGGDTLEFLETGFSVRDVLVNGKKENFADYLARVKADIKLPLVADYAGAMINVSFQGIDSEKKSVNFYAPVFKGARYKQAAAVKNYIHDFVQSVPSNAEHIFFSCNCILNFLYSELEGKKTGDITGPITFGEIAYQLLNQTMIYVIIEKVG